VTMPDTPENQKEYPQLSAQKTGGRLPVVIFVAYAKLPISLASFQVLGTHSDSIGFIISADNKTV
jgi:hypothetical protein